MRPLKVGDWARFSSTGVVAYEVRAFDLEEWQARLDTGTVLGAPHMVTTESTDLYAALQSLDRGGNNDGG